MFKSIDNLVECASYGSRKILAATAGLLLAAGAANATTITGTYTVGISNAHGNTPSITDNLPASFSINPTMNGPATAQQSFFTVTPANSCGSGCASQFEGSPYWTNEYTASATLTVTFTFTNMTPVAGSDLTETALYQAKYGGAALSCATASGPGQTDCVTWTISNPNGTDPLVINFTNGDQLAINFFDAEDWAITPKISFQLTDPGATPLPGALPLFVSGSGLLGLLGWRRQKRNAKAA